MQALKPHQQRYLRGLAHALKPTVQLGKQGLCKSLTEELSRHLDAHELVKVKVRAEDRETFLGYVDGMKKRCRAELVHVIGRTVVFYREARLRAGDKPKRKQLQLPS